MGTFSFSAAIAALFIVSFCCSVAGATSVAEGGAMCYVCDNCNSIGITTKMESGKYCKKSEFLGETSRAAVESCTSIPKVTYCCQTHLCNSAAGLITKKRLGLHAAIFTTAIVAAARQLF